MEFLLPPSLLYRYEFCRFEYSCYDDALFVGQVGFPSPCLSYVVSLRVFLSSIISLCNRLRFTLFLSMYPYVFLGFFLRVFLVLCPSATLGFFLSVCLSVSDSTSLPLFSHLCEFVTLQEHPLEDIPGQVRETGGGLCIGI